MGAIPTFMCPTVQDDPQILPDSTQRQIMLYRHFRPRTRGVNVWQRSDGTFCQDTATPLESSMTAPAPFDSDDAVGPDATDESTPYDATLGLFDTNINYPWNIANDTPQDLDYIQPKFRAPNDPKYPFSYVTQWDGSIVESFSNPFLVKWWAGGAMYEISQELAVTLSLAGYGDNITTP